MDPERRLQCGSIKKLLYSVQVKQSIGANVSFMVLPSMASTKLVAVVRGKIFESSSSILTSGSDSEVNSLEGGGGDIRLVIKKLQEIGVYVQVSGLSSCLGIYIIF